MSQRRLLMLCGLVSLIFFLTISGCNSVKKPVLYDKNSTTLGDKYMAAGTKTVTPFEGVLVPMDRYIWLLKCENNSE